MSRVFVIQRPAFRAPDGTWEDKYDLSPAEHFGELVELLPRGNVPRQLKVALTRIRVALADFSDNDHLLLLGDPVAIGLSVAIACRINDGKVSLLKWDRIHGEYRAYRANAW